MSRVWCCEEFYEYKSITDNIKMSEYSPETKEMSTVLFKDRFDFRFCPFCGRDYDSYE